MTVRKYPDFPPIPSNLPKEISIYMNALNDWWSQVKNLLGEKDQKTFEGAAGKVQWNITSSPYSYTFDRTLATDTYTADRLATLLQDFKEKGIIG